MTAQPGCRPQRHLNQLMRTGLGENTWARGVRGFERLYMEPRMCIPLCILVSAGPHFSESAEFRQFRGTHVGIKSFQGKINLVRNPTESRIPSGIPEGSATCNEHSERRHTKNWCQQWHSAVLAAAAIVTRRKPLRRAATTAATA